MCLHFQVLTHPDNEAAKVWLEDCRHSFAQMIHDKLTRDAEEAKTKVSALSTLSTFTPISCAALLRSVLVGIVSCSFTEAESCPGSNKNTPEQLCNLHAVLSHQ